MMTVRKLHLGYLQDSPFKIKGSGVENLFSFTPGFSEEELFKASILQNNPKAYNNVKRIFKMIHKDVGLLQDRASLLTVDDALKTLGKSEYQYLKNFDLIQAYAASEAGHTYGGIGKGILRETLLDKGINEASVPKEVLERVASEVPSILERQQQPIDDESLLMRNTNA